MPFVLMKFLCVHQSKHVHVCYLGGGLGLVFIFYFFVCENTKCEFIYVYHKVFGRSSMSYSNDYIIFEIKYFCHPTHLH